MKITYLGKKIPMVSFGYDFSKKRTIDVPDENEKVIKKFIGNRFFHADCDENYVAPKYYAYEIKKLPSMRNVITKRENIKVKGFDTLKNAEKWVSTHGKIDITHYIKPSDEDIADCSKLYTESDDNLNFGLFRLKSDGKPRSKPDKLFATKEEAEAYISEKEYDPEERVILEKK